jgi:hypothetical protein
MSANRLYHTWFWRIQQLWPAERITRLRNFAWLLAGIFTSRSVQLCFIALKIPGAAKQPSLTRRLSRFLDNNAVKVRAWYEPIARNWLETLAAPVGEVRLIVDTTRVGFGHRLLMVAVAYRRRALPLAWSWVKIKKGHTTADVQLALLRYVHSLVPPGARVLLVGDSEFGAVEVLRQLDDWCWQYVLRQTAKHQVQLTADRAWQNFGQSVSGPGQRCWLPGVVFTLRHAYRTNLVAYWQVGEKEPWLLATNLDSLTAALKAYRLRMWIEEMFGDLKGHGFDLESTHLVHDDRLSRLTLAVVMLYLWLVSAGAQAIKNGNRHWVDRVDRRDLSIFQIGFRWIERRITNDQPFSLPLTPLGVSKVSGG